MGGHGVSSCVDRRVSRRIPRTTQPLWCNVRPTAIKRRARARGDFSERVVRRGRLRRCCPRHRRRRGARRRRAGVEGRGRGRVHQAQGLDPEGRAHGVGDGAVVLATGPYAAGRRPGCRGGNARDAEGDDEQVGRPRRARGARCARRGGRDDHPRGAVDRDAGLVDGEHEVAADGGVDEQRRSRGGGERAGPRGAPQALGVARVAHRMGST
jgi:hypothetical protein